MLDFVLYAAPWNSNGGSSDSWINNGSGENAITAGTESGGLSAWDYTKIVPQIFSIALVAFILLAIFVYYFQALKKLNGETAPKGLALVLFTIIEYFKKLSFDTLGYKFYKFTPYFLTLFLYIWCSNLIGILGFENPTGSATVTFSMGIVTFVGTIVVGFRYQKLSYLKTFTLNIPIKTKKGTTKIPVMVNPLGVIGKITPLVSISLRLWGNIFAGGFILTLFYALPMTFIGLDPTKETWHPIIIIAGVVAPFLHGYFDLFVGTIQAYVFTLLTMVYWSLERGEDESIELDDRQYKFIDYYPDGYVKLSSVSTV